MKKKLVMHSMLVLGTAGLFACADTSEETVDNGEDSTQESADVNETSEDATNSNDNDVAEETSSDSEVYYSTQVNEDLVTQHENRYQEIREEFEGGDFTLQEPLVVHDPYNRAPLSAIALFETDEPTQITVTVEGQNEDATISHTYEGYETEHEVGVLGLYAETENQVTLVGETENGETTETTVVIETGTLPEDMLDFNVEVAQPELMEEGLTFVSPSRAYPAGVDNNGDVRWYTSIKSSNQFKRLENGNVLMATLEEGQEHHDHLTEMDMLGRVHQSIHIDMESVIASAPLHHDTIILPNDNYLALLHDGSDEFVEDELTEMDRETGEVVHRMNFRDVFPSEMSEEYEGQGDDVGDWAHINALWKLEDEESILFSIRNQDVILKMSYPEGEIDWLFGYPEDWPEELEDYLLEPIGEDFEFHAGAHAMMEMPDQDGDDSTLDIMLFDNNRIINRGDEEGDEEYSRAVQYRINEEEQTVEEIWSYGEERGTDFYSSIVGDADYLYDTNNVLITSGRVLNEEENQRYSMMVEVTTSEEPEVVYELHYGPFGADEYLQIYRAERMPLYPESY